MEGPEAYQQKMGTRCQVYQVYHAQLSTVVGVSWWHAVALVETWNLGDWGNQAQVSSSWDQNHRPIPGKDRDWRITIWCSRGLSTINGFR